MSKSFKVKDMNNGDVFCMGTVYSKLYMISENKLISLTDLEEIDRIEKDNNPVIMIDLNDGKILNGIDRDKDYIKSTISYVGADPFSECEMEDYEGFIKCQVIEALGMIRLNATIEHLETSHVGDDITVDEYSVKVYNDNFVVTRTVDKFRNTTAIEYDSRVPKFLRAWMFKELNK